jgi:hypothetical protein
MDIDFVWTTPTTTEFRDDLESKIRDDIESDSDMRPCHSGKITVELSSTDPLEATVNGKVVCECGKIFKIFSGPIDGSTLNYH